MRKSLFFLLFTSAAIAMTACSAQINAPEFPVNMTNINCISREDGSGTREVFENLIKTDSSGTSAISVSTDDVITSVEDDINSIGYIAYSTLDEKSGVKCVSVNGKEISKDSIKNDSYPLCRNYYLAYSGELSSASNDFIHYIMTEGQAIVNTECTAVKKSSTFLSDKSKGKITINGSTSVAPLIEKLSEDYKTYNPNVDFEITPSDSTIGLTAAIRGECDLAISSRELRSYESELLTKKEIAKDGIAVVVNKANPIESLTRKQLEKIYDGEYKKWSELG